MSLRWAIPNYVAIAAILAGIGMAAYLVHGLYAYAFY
jgi:hypothetical protein